MASTRRVTVVPVDHNVLQRKAADVEAKFNHSCKQITLLNIRMDDIEFLYNRAVKDGHRAFRYSYRLKLAAVEGVRNMFIEYARLKADQLLQIQCQLMDDPSSSDSSESDSSDSDSGSDFED